MTKTLQFFIAIGLLISSLTVNAQYTVRIIKTGVEAGVDVSYDDGEYENDAIDKLFDDDLDMGWEGEDLNIMTTFLRFQNVVIPQGAIIDSAFLLIYAHEDEADTARVTIFAEAANNSAVFTDTELITDRLWVNDSVKWTISESWTMWHPYKSVNIGSLIQGVANQPGWVSGNALTIFLRGEDQGASLLDHARDFESFENIEDPADGGDGLHHPERIPELVIYGSFTGMKDKNTKNNSVSIFPNPSNNGIFNVTISFSSASQIMVSDLAGSMVYEGSTTQTNSQLDLSHLSNGVYFVQIVSNERTFSQKIVINK
jgi:hypothetical protein